ncbi:3,4-dihydroxy-2-butanone-4-phosphate synthase [Flavobacteriaceae bacterium]|jgi:3,4-dihydroxy 2-butanone 4-phosphate synthase / GTP cyclohydrolase II|nr:3,4-dihydroxy-2-butanone-4-phosphate synthase [Flavobacteriaceae bacterium]MDB0042594.1 3,4-dihydroxy-2-butanone-4-phosphate synthase [Flavobacteriaceae bacterium]MDB4093934.1 3,4-dihydroxy-2-butanone-4-phosphate synthase [Flavobacteriaceae bacterium]MDB4148229.1 3,4-dihydroxy-2-butanone-4-phosphate synthase [Flavobacteriaceae bacterium]MDB4164245.1 3,4-dihydroxy-2-butanone-4-phosphate synthase [Flavobacteriaceae bacterium]|tara:strand:- start:894 stop:2021 length:1128 start_codon:yes stop_codon:yes gene_type:complete
MSKVILDKISDAIDDVKKGKIIIVVDDENRENEGDFICAADLVTPEIINFMAKHARGLICMPITEKRSRKLNLYPMVTNNTDPMDTAFTVSVDLKGSGVTSGISASDRSKTIKAIVEKNTKPEDLARPGHIFPLIAKDGGVLRRTGHTEAAIDFARLSGCSPAGVICEIMSEDGSMARVPELIKVAKKLDLKIVSIEDLVAYRMKHDSLITKKESFVFNTKFGDYNLSAFQQTNNNQIHLVLSKGEWSENEPVLVRINSSITNNDILTSLTSKSKNMLDGIFNKINDEEKGVIVFINQPANPVNVLFRLNEIKKLQSKGEYKTPPVVMDEKDFGIGAQILHDLNIHKIRLLTNSTQIKRVGMTGYGLEIVEYINY